MATLHVGPTLDDRKARVEEAVDAHFQSVRARQGFYAHKILEARRVKAGEHSDLLAAEAKVRGAKTGDIADAILSQARNDEDRELERVRLKLKVRKAKGLPRLRSLVKHLGIEV